MSSKYSAELFLEACGRTGPLQLSVDDTARPGPIRCVFHQPFLVVGRDPNADLHLDNWRVSRRHAYLQLVAGRLFCLDLGSRTGIQWADVANEAGWLDFGRTIRIGPYEIGRWSHALTPTPALALPEPHDFAGAAYQIEALTKTPLTSTTRVNLDLALVGRSSGCLVRLPYPDVSKAHCSLIRTPLGVWAVDLLGRGGIYVNESDVRFARLDDGDELRIGRHVLRFRLDEAIDANATVITTALPQLPRPMDDPSTSENPRPVRTLPVLPTPPSTSMAIVPTWQYPDGEIQRVLSDQPGSQAELIGQLMQPMVQQFGLMQQQMFEQFHHAMMGMFQQFGSFYREQMADLREELDEVRRLTKELQGLRDEARLPAAPVPTPPPPPRPLPATGAEAATPAEPTIRRPPSRTDPGVHGLLFDRIAMLQTERQTRWQKILGMLHRSSD